MQAMQKSIQKGFKVAKSTIFYINSIYVHVHKHNTHSRIDNDESDEYCPYCDNHYVLPAQEPESINLAELLQQQLLQFNDPRMKTKFSDFDEEFEAMLQDQ